MQVKPGKVQLETGINGIRGLMGCGMKDDWDQWDTGINGMRDEE
jgi:hypothetical protein